MASVVLTLIQNVALLVTLSVAHSVVVPRFGLGVSGRRVVSGFIFGVTGIVAMMTPLVLSEGLIFDSRSVILAVAGLTGGWVSGGIAAIMCIIYRVGLGGDGAMVGVLVISEAAILGAVFRSLLGRRPAARSIWLWVLGLLVHVVMLGLMLLLPGGTGTSVLLEIGLPVMLVFPLATVLLSTYLIDEEERGAALKGSEERFRRAFEVVPDVVVVYDTELRIDYINTATAELTGRPESEFIGKRDEDIWPPEVYEQYMPVLEAALATGERREIDVVLEFEGGEPRALHITCVPVLADDGSVAEVIGVTHDYTERKLLIDELREHRDHLEELVESRTQELSVANEELVRATATKDRFMASMSHELRTPLNSVIGFSGVLLQGIVGPLNEEQSRQIEMIRDAGEHLLALINQILDVAKLASGKIDVEPARVDIEEMLEAICEQMRPGLEEIGLELACDVSPGLDSIVTDERRLRQILLNLLSNAGKHAGEGKATLRVTPAGDSVEFAVEDTGPGIDMDDRTRIFDDFEQLASDSTAGTGLGLSISRDLAKALGGTLAVDPHYRDGARFVLTLPDLPVAPPGK